MQGSICTEKQQFIHIYIFKLKAGYRNLVLRAVFSKTPAVTARHSNIPRNWHFLHFSGIFFNFFLFFSPLQQCTHCAQYKNAKKIGKNPKIQQLERVLKMGARLQLANIDYFAKFDDFYIFSRAFSMNIDPKNNRQIRKMRRKPAFRVGARLQTTRGRARLRYFLLQEI